MRKRQHAQLWLAGVILAAVGGCAQPQEKAISPQDSRAKLEAILDAKPAEFKARYGARNPAATLEFLGVRPGMTVVEVLPGEGWYSQILAPYLGPEGALIAADYPASMFANFEWATPEWIAQRDKWGAEWIAKREQWGGPEAAPLSAYRMDSLPTSLDGKVDAVLFIRALHGMARFESQGQFMSKALKRSFELLKPGGILGIVQHEARPEMSDEFARGEMGYLKKSAVIAAAEAAGFELAGTAPINENPADQPGPQDSVWRLPPSLSDSQDDPIRKNRMVAIGESNRMTLRFIKPRP